MKYCRRCLPPLTATTSLPQRPTASYHQKKEIKLSTFLAQIAGKADSQHPHALDDVNNLVLELSERVKNNDNRLSDSRAPIPTA